MNARTRTKAPLDHEVEVTVQDFRIVGRKVWISGSWDIEDVYLHSKSGVALYVDDAAKMGAFQDGKWTSFADLLMSEGEYRD
jgi:hypothetical protein